MKADIRSKNETQAQANTVLHVDINSYFATMIQQENPKLRGRPLGITKDVGRSCIIAASKEAKKFGVKTGSSLVEARQLCPEILPVPASFGRYLDATKRLKNIFRNISPEVEIYSLDEAFIDITHCQKYLYPDADKLGKEIQKMIKDELGNWVTATVGISWNRFLAKMAGEISPPESVFKIDEKNLESVLATTEFRDVCGIGFRLEKKLRMLGVDNPYMIRFIPEDELEKMVGPYWVRELLKMAYGREPSHLARVGEKLPHMKSVGRSITGYKTYELEKDKKEIRAILYNLMEEVTHKAREMNLAGRHVLVYLNGQDGRGEHVSWGDHRTLQYYVQHTEQMFEVLYRQLYLDWAQKMKQAGQKFKIIKFGVRLDQLQPTDDLTCSLLPSEQKLERISEAVDEVTQRWGLFTVKSGALLNQPEIRPEVTGWLGDKSYHGL